MNHLEEIRDFWNLRSHGFSDAVKEELDGGPGKVWTDLFRETLGDEPLDVLDDGAGPGFFSMILSGLGHRVTSIDYSDRMLERLRSNMREQGYESRAIQMDAQKLTFADASFDAVVQRNVLWNLDDPGTAYAEIFRVLKPGGIALIDDGNFYLAAHDDEYAADMSEKKAAYEKMKKAMKDMPGNHFRHNPENVDFTIIDKVAVTQPLSYERRPQWDLDQMIRLGFRDLHVEIEGKGLPHHFRITARKPE